MAVTAVFPQQLRPNYGVEKEPVFNTEIIEYGGATEQRIVRWKGARHRFRISFNNITKDEADALYDFFIERQGAAEPFIWTNPEDNTQYIVRFAIDRIKHNAFTLRLYRFGEIELVEVDE
ncbi:MAG: DUF2460 domain-containing protein [Planctomycetota bacterium]